MSGGVWALVPIKDFARAKSRLSTVLTVEARAALARRLARHVLAALQRCPAVDGILVMSDSEEVLALAAELGAAGEREPPSASSSPSLATIVEAGLSGLAARRAQAALVVMSDLPWLTSDELTQLVARLADHDWVVAPDLREQNTNALALRLAAERPVATAFGSGDSFRGHRHLAESTGQRLAIYRARGLAFDLDLPSDYAKLTASER